MSLTFNMVGGGGGGLKNTDAVLIVTVPTGSTVTATKGGTTITPTMWVKAADQTLDCAIFSIPASQFDSTTPWTITATDGTNTASDTILITTNKEYEVVLSSVLYLYENGTFSQSYATTNLATNGTISDEASYILCASTANQTPYVYKRWDSVNLTRFSTLTAYMQGEVVGTSAGSTVWAKVFLTQNASLTIASQAEVKQTLQSNAGYTGHPADFNFSIDVSNLTGLWYVGVGIDNDGAAGAYQRKGYIYTVILYP